MRIRRFGLARPNHGRSGGRRRAAAPPQAVISAVNYAEVVRRLKRSGMPFETITSVLSPLLLRSPVPFDETQAEQTARIQHQAQERALSFGDAACLALALSLKAPAVTTEAGWEDLGVQIIRVE
ncbi:PIN domain-containing protein [Singulisphaera sp. PoT]|uniref:PIN domain-containing protein n=1 Tax=Singulisphaera sp. PoT TaxID=3411797 RepID=UPI003BF555F6